MPYGELGPITFSARIDGALSLFILDARPAQVEKKKKIRGARVSERKPCIWPGFSSFDFYFYQDCNFRMTNYLFFFA